SQKWKSGNKSYAGDTILSRAVKTDDFARRRLRASGNVINVDCELSVITDWNFEQAHTRRCTAAMPAAVIRLRRGYSGQGARGYNSTNTRRQPLEHLVRRFSSFDDSSWVEKNRDACVSRCKLDNSGDVCASKLLKCAEDRVQYFLRRVLEALAQADDERGISEGNDFHQLVTPSGVEKSRSKAGSISPGILRLRCASLRMTIFDLTRRFTLRASPRSRC